MSRSRRLLGLALTASLPAVAGSYGGIEVPAPPPPRNVVETHWGVAVDDPYRFFEDVKDPAVAAWMKGQAVATEAILARLPGRDAFLARVEAISSQASGAVAGTVRVAGGRYFFTKRDPEDNQFRLVARDTASGSDRLIVDPEALSKLAGTLHAILDFAPSPDGKRVAYALQTGGGEIGTLHVVDVASGRPLITPIDRIRYAGVSWLDDGSGFFYSRLREGYEKLPSIERFNERTRHFRALDVAATDLRVFSPGLNAELKLPGYASGEVFQIPGTRRAAALVRFGVERIGELYVADLAAARTGKASWQRVVSVDDRATSIDIAGGYIYLRTSKDAPRYQVVRMPLAAPGRSQARVVMPSGEGVITSIRAAKDALYIVRRDGSTQSLWRLAHHPRAKPEPIALPFAGAVRIESATPHRDGVLLSLAGWTRAARPYEYEPSTSKVRPLPFVAPAALDAPGDIAAREVRYRSHDGVEVPLSILSRKDVKLDGDNPTILFGYGAYGITENPFFSPQVYAWLERGGVYAIAHVRGGGAFGEPWHLAGRKTTKPNTWKDAIAAAEWLIANRYTSAKRLSINGGSAGGIFVGRAITERPDLFAAAVPSVGVFDGPRFEASANGVANVPEFGSVRIEEEFRALMAMSTYHAITDGTHYPAILLPHGVNDVRVDVWQTLKVAARFAAATASGKPVLMRLEYDSGHGQGSTRVQSQRRFADIASFLLWQFGEPDFQPVANPDLKGG